MAETDNPSVGASIQTTKQQVTTFQPFSIFEKMKRWGVTIFVVVFLGVALYVLVAYTNCMLRLRKGIQTVRQRRNLFTQNCREVS